MIVEEDNSSRSTAGFSILEMLIVLAIVALVAISRPFFRGAPDQLQLRIAARDIVSAMKSSRAAAIARNSEISMIFDVENRTFGSSFMKTVAVPQNVQLDLKVAAPERLTVSRGRVRFFPDGSSTGGDLNLILGARSRTICVNWLTGITHEDDECTQR